MNLREKELQGPASLKRLKAMIHIHKHRSYTMSLKSTFRRSLSMIAEARCICRSFSTQGGSLRAEARSNASKSMQNTTSEDKC